MTSGADVSGALHGCTVVVTRERPGTLAAGLRAAGATVVHVPLIEVRAPVADDERALVDALGSDPDWVIVTSAAGAERVAAVRDQPSVRLAAVGTATAATLADVAGRKVDLVPATQLAQVLVDEFVARIDQPCRVVVAQADRAASTLAAGLRDAGHSVSSVTAYRTVLRSPSAEEIDDIRTADAVAFASGSAARSWHEALGGDAVDLLPGIVAAIGPTTSSAAREVGLKITHESVDHSVTGLIETLQTAWSSHGGASG